MGKQCCLKRKEQNENKKKKSFHLLLKSISQEIRRTICKVDYNLKSTLVQKLYH